MAESIHVSKLRNVTESSLPEILINRTSYLPHGTLEISMLECRESKKGDYIHHPWGDFLFLISIIWFFWQQPGEMMS